MQKTKSKYKNDLIARCYKFSISIVRLSDTLPSKRSSWVIQDQLIRSATSVGANLVEAKASSSRKEFKKFHEIALKSSNESKYWIALLRDTDLADKDKCNSLLKENEEISSMIAAGIIKLKKI